MTLGEAQQDVRQAHVRGGPGAIISGVVWLVAAVALSKSDVKTAFTVLFFGGFLIFPCALLICRGFMRRESERKTNTLTRIALESTIAMIGGLFVAWLLVALKPELVFPVAAIAVGTHYFPFRTLYGDITFTILGAFMTTIGFAGIYNLLPPASVPWGIAIVEIGFGIFLTWFGRQPARSH